MKKNRKLKLIAVIGAITIFSYVGASTTEANAGAFFSRSSSVNITQQSSSNLWGRLKSLAYRIHKVELNCSDLGSSLKKSLSSGWNKFKGLFTKTSGSKYSYDLGPENVPTSFINQNYRGPEPSDKRESLTSTSSSSSFSSVSSSSSESSLTKVTTGATTTTSQQDATSTTTGESPKKYTSKGFDRFYDGSFDEERKKYIYYGDTGTDSSTGGFGTVIQGSEEPTYATVVKGPEGKMTVKYSLGNEPEGRSVLKVTKTDGGGTKTEPIYDKVSEEVIYDEVYD